LGGGLVVEGCELGSFCGVVDAGFGSQLDFCSGSRDRGSFLCAEATGFADVADLGCSVRCWAG
jgi:hypothetical protein